MAGKYDPLENYLRELSKSQTDISLSFEQMVVHLNNADKTEVDEKVLSATARCYKRLRGVPKRACESWIMWYLPMILPTPLKSGM